MRLFTIFMTTIMAVSQMDLAASISPQMQTTESGLQYEDTLLGSGAQARKGDVVEVHYTGWLYNDGQKGAEFDSSHTRNETFSFKIGSGMVIQGWEQGLIGMKEGGKRLLIIPPLLAYGSRGAGRAIPPNSTLLFEVQLVKICNR